MPVAEDIQEGMSVCKEKNPVTGKPCNLKIRLTLQVFKDPPTRKFQGRVVPPSTLEGPFNQVTLKILHDKHPENKGFCTTHAACEYVKFLCSSKLT